MLIRFAVLFTRFTLLLALAGAFFALSISPTLALSERQQDAAIASLQSAVKALQSTVSSQATTITSLQSQVNRLKSVTSGFSRQTDTTRADRKKGTELFLTGFNLHVVNGLGVNNGDMDTGVVNGLGNVIIGYNASRGPNGNGNTDDVRTGSHNLIVGNEQNYSSFGGLLGGYYNTMSGPYANVIGGESNTASGEYSSITCGNGNTASGLYSSISGGFDSTASGAYASVSGGYQNKAQGDYSSVLGGPMNTASGDTSCVSGGGSNTSKGDYSNISGGLYVLANKDFGFAAGGQFTPQTPGLGTFHSP